MEDKYKDYFQQAKDKLRFTGVGGLHVPNPDLTADPTDPRRIDPARRLTVDDDGWVLMGGSPARRSGGRSSVQILKASSKIIDERNARAAKENPKSNEPNTDKG